MRVMGVNMADWIIIGGGLTGVSLGYELAKAGQSVLILERDRVLQGATRWSYGGIAYWSGTTPVLRQICQESHDRYGALTSELSFNIEYRETQLLITIDRDQDPASVLADYQTFALAPELLSPAAVKTAEPLLKVDELNGALRFPHACVNPTALTQAYRQAFQAQGGQIQYGMATMLCANPQQNRVIGVQTPEGIIQGDQVIVCAGGQGRSLLTPFGFPVPLYFTQAELIETDPTELRLESVILPANQSRLRLEAKVTPSSFEESKNPRQELAPPALEPGGVQFQDGHLCLGQISRLSTTPHSSLHAAASEALIRQGIRRILPDLADLPGRWQHCLVSFSPDGLPLIGALSPWQNLHLFSGFTSPFALVPALAVRFAQALVTNPDPLLTIFRPDRGD